MSTACDVSFRSMGSDIRLLIGTPLRPGAIPAAAAGERERAYVEDFAARLSRFRPDSELSSLNGAPGWEVQSSPLLRAAVRAGIWAAQMSGGLVDPTLTGALERAGYDSSLERRRPASLEQALAAAPPRQGARPHPARLWSEVSVHDDRCTIRRPPGVKLDTGGTGKGLCADAVAHRLRDYSRFVVDCGGDLAIGGVGAQLDPYDVEVEHPLTGETIRTVRVGCGAIATSGVNVRVWQDAHGGFAHHLLDPSSGMPAWTGVIGVTALGSSALEAETLAKMALLLGERDARRVLSRHGGLIVRDDGDVHEIGPLDRPHGTLELTRSAA